MDKAGWIILHNLWFISKKIATFVRLKTYWIALSINKSLLSFFKASSWFFSCVPRQSDRRMPFGTPHAAFIGPQEKKTCEIRPKFSWFGTGPWGTVIFWGILGGSEVFDRRFGRNNNFLEVKLINFKWQSPLPEGVYFARRVASFHIKKMSWPLSIKGTSYQNFKYTCG